jgi:hypothetical protein
MRPSRPDDLAASDDELSALLLALRRHVLSPDDAWAPEVQDAAKQLAAAIAARLETAEGHSGR